MSTNSTDLERELAHHRELLAALLTHFRLDIEPIANGQGAWLVEQADVHGSPTRTVKMRGDWR